MMDFIRENLFLLACTCSGLCVTFASFVIMDFILFTSARYREKFLQEASVEMDDVLLQLPPARILDLSLALAALAVFISCGAVFLLTDEPTVLQFVFIGILTVSAAFPAPRLFLRHLWRQRMAKFNEQLEDALLSISSSLKAGFSINQALDGIAQENRRPISYEFTLLTQELRLGVPFETALRKMSDRLRNPDFELVSVAIITARQTGGELTSVLERLASVIRERVRIMHRVQSLTAQGRMQAWLIGAVPVFLFFIMFYISPDMMKSFFSSVTGILILAAVLVMDAIGFFIIRKITKIDI